MRGGKPLSVVLAAGAMSAFAAAIAASGLGDRMDRREQRQIAHPKPISEHARHYTSRNRRYAAGSYKGSNRAKRATLRGGNPSAHQ